MLFLKNSPGPRSSINCCEYLLLLIFMNILSGTFWFWRSQCSTQTQMTHPPVTMRACLTPDPPSSRQRTVLNHPLTLIKSKLCRTWVESTWWEHLWSCSWLLKWTQVLFHSCFSVPQGAVWTMKFSHCGRLLATAGQDNMVRIWVLKTAFDYFNNMRLKYNTEGSLISELKPKLIWILGDG